MVRVTRAGTRQKESFAEEETCGEQYGRVQRFDIKKKKSWCVQ